MIIPNQGIVNPIPTINEQENNTSGTKWVDVTKGKGTPIPTGGAYYPAARKYIINGKQAWMYGDMTCLGYTPILKLHLLTELTQTRWRIMT